MMVTIPAMAAPAIHIIVRHPRRWCMVIEDMGDAEGMGDMVRTEVMAAVPGMGHPQCALVRPPNLLEGDESFREVRSGRPLTRQSHRAGNQLRAGALPVGVVALAKAVAARNSGLWYTIRRG